VPEQQVRDLFAAVRALTPVGGGVAGFVPPPARQ